jgi:tetratricopeptide (TPR) repeat protein
MRMAIHAYHRTLECDPTHRLALISFGRMKHRIGDLDGAIVTYRQSLKFHPNDPLALNDLGLCHARRGETEQALQCIGAASRLAPESRRYMNNLAAVLAEDEQYEQALSVLTQAHGPALGHFNLAMFLKQRGKLAASAQHARQAATLDPSLTPARQLLTVLGEPRDDAPRIASTNDLPVGDSIRCDLMGEVAPEPSDTEAEAPAAAAPTSASEAEQERAHWNFLKARANAASHAK